MNNSILDGLKLANDLSDKMDQLLKIQNQAIDSLPPEEKAKLSFVSQDINGIKKCVKDGDISALDKYIKKYADISSKG